MSARNFVLLFLLFLPRLYSIDPDIPVFYQGRYHPANAYAHLWQEGYLPKSRPLDLLWKRHFLGNEPWDEIPFFRFQRKKWSSNELKLAFSEKPLDFLRSILIVDTVKKYRNQSKIELFPGLWTELEGDDLLLWKVPDSFPWHFLKPKTVILEGAKSKWQGLEKAHRIPSEEQRKLLEQIRHYKEDTFKALPGPNGEWFSLKELKTQSENFTLYPDTLFEDLKKTYLLLERAYLNHHSPDDLDRKLSELLREGYRKIEGQKIKQAYGKALLYPTFTQLKAEALLFRFPFIELTIFLYFVALVFYRSFWGVIFTELAILAHTVLLLLRSFIMGRPPVTNMYETMLFVPWITAFFGLCLYFAIKNRSILIGANLGALVILSLVLFGPLNDRLENVPAVLDSQYWLIIHVMMVVGSYGFFILSGVLSHFYFFSSHQSSLTKGILQTTYLGTALLITGTILGGVWAAQSWGRFWDWDPKESWAFISCSVYLILIHLYRFNQISSKGLAIGAIIGLQFITFTWYGVNYILGTGLHSYGFGSGGSFYYLVFVAIESAFIISALRNLPFNLLHAKIFFIKKQF